MSDDARLDASENSGSAEAAPVTSRASVLLVTARRGLVAAILIVSAVQVIVAIGELTARQRLVGQLDVAARALEKLEQQRSGKLLSQLSEQAAESSAEETEGGEDVDRPDAALAANIALARSACAHGRRVAVVLGDSGATTASMRARYLLGLAYEIEIFAEDEAHRMSAGIPPSTEDRTFMPGEARMSHEEPTLLRRWTRAIADPATALSTHALVSLLMCLAAVVGAGIGCTRRASVIALGSLVCGAGSGFIAFLIVVGGRGVFLLDASAFLAWKPGSLALAALLAGLFSERSFGLLTSAVDATVTRLQAAIAGPGDRTSSRSRGQGQVERVRRHERSPEGEAKPERVRPT